MVHSFLRNPALWILILVAIVGTAYLIGFNPFATPEPAPEEFHIHADFALFIDGVQLNFAQEKYMSETAHKLSPYVHLHDGVGTIIHVHAPGITIGDFFDSLGMKLTNTCFTDDQNQEYCADETQGLHMLVNGTPVSVNPNYEMNDLDQILLSYGEEDAGALQAEFSHVTNDACIQSGKCPERGEPSDESTCTTTGGCAVGRIPTAP